MPFGGEVSQLPVQLQALVGVSDTAKVRAKIVEPLDQSCFVVQAVTSVRLALRGAGFAVADSHPTFGRPGLGPSS